MVLLKSCHRLGYFPGLADPINVALEELVRARLELSTPSPQTADQRFSLPIAGFRRTPVGPVSGQQARTPDGRTET